MLRELWESRSIYIAPLAVAALTLVGHLIATIGRAMSVTNLAQRGAILEEHYSFAEFAIMGTTFVVAVFYCLDALHGERRDRSILFWKSLPVSDLTTVLSKAAIPLVVLPLLTFAITVLTQLIMALMSSVVLLGSGLSVATLWAQLSLPSDLAGAALPSRDGSFALVRANLRLVAAGFGLGAARTGSVGRGAAARDRAG